MSNVLRIALVDPHDKSRESLKAMLLGMDTVWLEADCSRYEFYSDVIEQTAPDVGVVSLDDDPDRAIGLIERLVVDFPDTAILAVSENTDGHQILRTIRAGAREFLTLPLTAEDLATALGRVSQQKFGGYRRWWAGLRCDRHRRRHRRGWDNQRCREPGLRVVIRCQEQRGLVGSGLSVRRCRRLSRCDSRLHAGRCCAKRLAFGHSVAQAVVDEAFQWAVPAAPPGGTSRHRRHHRREHSQGDRFVESFIFALDHRSFEDVQPRRHGGHRECHASHSVDPTRPAVPAQRRTFDDEL